MAVERMSLDVLLVEDNPGDARLVEHHLDAPQVADIAGDVTLHHEETLSDGVEALSQGSYDTLFLDLGLPESTGLQTLDRVLQEDPRLPVVVLTGLDDRERAIKAIQSGAQDYLLKDDLDADLLGRTLRYAVERYRQEEALRRQNERLDEFASVVSHDLRNPLNVASGRIELAREEYESVHIESVATALDRMETLVDDLLTLARQGETVDEPELVDVAVLAEECWQNVETADASLRVDVAHAVRADRSRLKQLLENLIRNAVEHGSADATPSDDAAGGDAITVTVGSLDEEGLYVADDGRGVPEREREQVFEGGYSTSVDGTGFGLMIAREIVKAHGWEIRVTDGTDGGARFEISGIEPARE